MTKLARLDRKITRCHGCGSWIWAGKCACCPILHRIESTELSTAA